MIEELSQSIVRELRLVKSTWHDADHILGYAPSLNAYVFYDSDKGHWFTVPAKLLAKLIDPR